MMYLVVVVELKMMSLNDDIIAKEFGQELFLLLFLRDKSGDLVNDGQRLGALGHKDLGHHCCEGSAQGAGLVRGVLQVLRHGVQEWHKALVDHCEPFDFSLFGSFQFRVRRSKHATQAYNIEDLTEEKLVIATTCSPLSSEVVQLHLEDISRLAPRLPEQFLQRLLPLGSLAGEHGVDVHRDGGVEVRELEGGARNQKRRVDLVGPSTIGLE